MSKQRADSDPADQSADGARSFSANSDSDAGAPATPTPPATAERMSPVESLRRDSERLLIAALALAGHELSQCLTAIRCHAAAAIMGLRDQTISHAELLASLESISAQTESGSAVVDRLRARDGLEAADLRSFDLFALLDDALRRDRLEWEQRRIQVRVGVGPRAFAVKCDAAVFQTIFATMIRALADAGPAGRKDYLEIVIRAEPDKRGQVELRVSSISATPGIADLRDLKRITVDSAAGRNMIPLAGCQALAVGLGGNLRAEKGPGGGLSFVLRLAPSSEQPHVASGQTVYVLDDEPAVRAGLVAVLERAGLRTRACADAEEFLGLFEPQECACLVLDVYLQNGSGLDLCAELRSHKIGLPVIYITGRGDIRTAVQAMKHGGFDFLEKPVDPELLCRRVQEALALAAGERELEADRAQVMDRLRLLTRRERQVLRRITTGAPNKRIATDLAVSEKTIEVHRKHIMRKMHVQSAVDLVRMILGARLECDEE